VLLSGVAVSSSWWLYVTDIFSKIKRKCKKIYQTLAFFYFYDVKGYFTSYHLLSLLSMYSEFCALAWSTSSWHLILHTRDMLCSLNLCSGYIPFGSMCAKQYALGSCMCFLHTEHWWFVSFRMDWKNNFSLGWFLFLLHIFLSGVFFMSVSDINLYSWVMFVVAFSDCSFLDLVIVFIEYSF
jgi:hypothetical protein